MGGAVGSVLVGVFESATDSAYGTFREVTNLKLFHSCVYFVPAPVFCLIVFVGCYFFLHI